MQEQETIKGIFVTFQEAATVLGALVVAGNLVAALDASPLGRVSEQEKQRHQQAISGISQVVFQPVLPRNVADFVATGIYHSTSVFSGERLRIKLQCLP